MAGISVRAEKGLQKQTMTAGGQIGSLLRPCGVKRPKNTQCFEGFRPLTKQYRMAGKAILTIRIPPLSVLRYVTKSNSRIYLQGGKFYAKEN